MSYRALFFLFHPILSHSFLFHPILSHSFLIHTFYDIFVTKSPALLDASSFLRFFIPDLSLPFFFISLSSSLPIALSSSLSHYLSLSSFHSLHIFIQWSAALTRRARDRIRCKSPHIHHLEQATEHSALSPLRAVSVCRCIYNWGQSCIHTHTHTEIDAYQHAHAHTLICTREQIDMYVRTHP